MTTPSRREGQHRDPQGSTWGGAISQCAHVFFEQNARPDELLEQKQDIDSAKAALHDTPERSRRIIEMRLDGHTYDEIGKRCGISRERVRGVIIETVEAVRRRLGIRRPLRSTFNTVSNQTEQPCPPAERVIATISHDPHSIDRTCRNILLACTAPGNLYGATIVQGPDVTECVGRLWKAGYIRMHSYSDEMWVVEITIDGREHVNGAFLCIPDCIKHV